MKDDKNNERETWTTVLDLQFLQGEAEAEEPGAKAGATIPRRLRKVLSEADHKRIEVLKRTHLSRNPAIKDLADEGRLLEPLGETTKLSGYLKELWHRRHFMWQESKKRVINKASHTFLGPFWLVIDPLLSALFYWVIFGIVLGISRGMDNFVAFIIIGILSFQFTSTSISQGANAIKSARNMIRAFAYPRAAIPISLVMREGLAQIFVIFVMITMILLIPPRVEFGPVWALFPAIFILQVMINLGLAFIFARFGYKMPDLAQAMSFLVRILMYGSGVIFPVERFIQNETALMIIKANPVYIMLDCYRSILMENTLPSTGSLLGLAAWAVGLLVIGFVYFRAGEQEYAREQR